MKKEKAKKINKKEKIKFYIQLTYKMPILYDFSMRMTKAQRWEQKHARRLYEVNIQGGCDDLEENFFIFKKKKKSFFIMNITLFLHFLFEFQRQAAFEAAASAMNEQNGEVAAPKTK